MNTIIIEAKSKDTPECHFLSSIIKSISPDMEFDFIPMDGISNLFRESVFNQIAKAEIRGDQIVILADADTINKGCGYERRKANIEDGLAANALNIPYFLYPHNHDDGDVETLMEDAARRDLHGVLFDCYEDYERCVSGARDKAGNSLYNVPNHKGKLHTYINAQQLSKKQRDRLGRGDWLFNDIRFWDLNVVSLQPLRDFLTTTLK